MSSITTTAQTIEVSGVADIIVTDAVADATNGGFVREVRIKTSPEDSAPIVFKLVLRADEEAPLNVDVPGDLTF